MSRSSTCVLLYAMPSLQGCMPCIFVISVVTSTSMYFYVGTPLQDFELSKAVLAFMGRWEFVNIRL